MDNLAKKKFFCDSMWVDFPCLSSARGSGWPEPMATSRRRLKTATADLVFCGSASGTQANKGTARDMHARSLEIFILYFFI